VGDSKTTTIVAQGPLALVVHPSMGIKATAALIAPEGETSQYRVRKRRTGTSRHLAGELFKRSAGADMLHVPYERAGELIAAVARPRYRVYHARRGRALHQGGDGEVEQVVRVATIKD
jgi:tripartite-type tricarboxylate transporter receptor subunit TctC